ADPLRLAHRRVAAARLAGVREARRSGARRRDAPRAPAGAAAMSAHPGPREPEIPRSGRRRRRRRRGGERRGLYLLPQLFTSANLFFGFYSIIQATQGHFDRAAGGIVLAALCDALDGRVARLARSTSRFGSEYDSLADVVSFG